MRIGVFFCDKCQKPTKHYIKSGKCIRCNLLLTIPKREHLTAEHRAKISLSLKGKKVSIETRRKLSDLNKGKTHSLETKQKMSNSHKDWYNSSDNYLKFFNSLYRGWHHTQESKEFLKSTGGWNMQKRYDGLGISEIYLYLIYMPSLNAFKVGIAKDGRRINQILRDSKDENSMLIFKIKGDIRSICAIEKEIHKTLKGKHIIQDIIKNGKTEIYPRNMYECVLGIIDERLYI